MHFSQVLQVETFIILFAYLTQQLLDLKIRLNKTNLMCYNVLVLICWLSNKNKNLFQISATQFVEVTTDDRFYLTLLENFGEGILEMEFCGYKI